MFGVFVKITSIKPYEAKKVTTTTPANKTGKNVPPPPPASNKNKLSNELLEQQSNEIQSIKEELEKAYERIREF